jgi:hypothetical protein
MCKLKIIIIMMILNSTLTYCQSDSVKCYINRLGWDSFAEEIGFAPQINFGKDIQRLISIEDTKKIDALINNFGNMDKTVAIHIILTRIFFITTEIGFKISSDDGPWITYEYNGLKWRREGPPNHRIKKKEVVKFINYWTKIRKDHIIK